MRVLQFIKLTKPGIIFGNLLPCVAGFLLASSGVFNASIIYVILGTMLVIASGCVFNNYIDQDIDKLMERTKLRPLITQKISPKEALIFGTLLGILGIIILYFKVNALSSICGIIGLFVYVILYSIFTKRTTTVGVYIGAISGAMPPLIGYTAVSGSIDGAAILLFLLLVIWQMPHFFAISVFNANDYKKAGIITIFNTYGERYTKINILIYTILFVLINASFTLLGYTGLIHLISALFLGIYWVWIGICGFKTQNITKWSKKIFFISLIIIISTSITLSFGKSIL
jgi:protoheme IX farnesyltransferase